MEEIVKGFGTTELVIMLLLGIVVLFFGYRIKKVAFFIAWFILGFVGTSYLMPQISQAIPEVANTQIYQILIQITGGILLSLLGFSIEKLCVGGLCFALVMLVSVQYFGSEMQTIAISAIIGVVVAGVAVMMMKPAAIIATSGVGAYAVTIAFLMLITGVSYNTFYWPMLIGFTLVGSIVQFLTTKHLS